MKNATILLLAAAAGMAHASPDDAVPAATPYRPSVSTPAALSAPGWLELEAGVQHDHDGAVARRDSLPVTLKLAFSDDWGVRLGWDGPVRQTDDSGARLSGAGDLSLVLKRRFALDEASAFGLEAGAALPSGRRGIRREKADFSVNTIYSRDLPQGFHTDLNLVFTRIGAPDAGAGRLQRLWAASLSRPLSERIGLTGELSGTQQSGTEATRQFLGALSYNLSPSLVLDAGAARSLRGGGVWSAFAGLTWVAARVF